MSDPYVDPGTGVLYNKLGLQTWAELLHAEREITTAREVELHEHPPARTYDLDHLRAVHCHLFGDIYDWAGEPRTINMAKEGPRLRPGRADPPLPPAPVQRAGRRGVPAQPGPLGLHRRAHQLPRRAEPKFGRLPPGRTQNLWLFDT